MCFPLRHHLLTRRKNSFAPMRSLSKHLPLNRHSKFVFTQHTSLHMLIIILYALSRAKQFPKETVAAIPSRDNTKELNPRI